MRSKDPQWTAIPLGDSRRKHTNGISTTLQPTAARIAGAQCAVLLTGETGVGKGHAARWLHENSARAGRPMIPVNCGAIPGDLIDSQLFGHMRGAFTGADRQHIGLVRAAAGGTLLLDEVSELPLTAQVRLLRLLEEREVLPVGCAEPKRVDVRIFASTNSDLRAKVEDGSFRKDLFHRLNVIELRIAPLRERVDEIADLFEQFNHEFADLYDQLPVTVSDAAKRVLRLYDWPGNVRELRIVTERLHVLCPDETVTVDHLARCGQLPVRLGATDSGGKAVVQIEMKQDRLLPQRMQHARTEAVRRVLARCGGSVSSAAREIGVHRSTLYRWLASN